MILAEPLLSLSQTNVTAEPPPCLGLQPASCRECQLAMTWKIKIHLLGFRLTTIAATKVSQRTSAVPLAERMGVNMRVKKSKLSDFTAIHIGCSSSSCA
jgi:hypothetical protein